jgi:hypothetical protein
MSRYHAIKYIHGNKTGKKTNIFEQKKALTNLVDLIRITHAAGESGSVIEELIKNGKIVSVTDDEETWERLKSSGKTWEEIMSMTKVPHMALLRNLRNIIQEYSSSSLDRTKDIENIGNFRFDISPLTSR